MQVEQCESSAATQQDGGAGGAKIAVVVVVVMGGGCGGREGGQMPEQLSPAVACCPKQLCEVATHAQEALPQRRLSA